MVPGMVAESMAPVEQILYLVGLPPFLEPTAEGKEGGPCPTLIEEVEDHGCVHRMGAIVEGQVDHSAVPSGLRARVGRGLATHRRNSQYPEHENHQDGSPTAGRLRWFHRCDHRRPPGREGCSRPR